MNQPKQDIQKIGKALLVLNLQNTHSGNISFRQGSTIYITASGSMKGHLRERDIVEFDAGEPVETVARASSEARTHRAILEFSRAVIHTHSPNATLISLAAPAIVPVDFLGRHYLGSVPVVEFESPVASEEISKNIPEVLAGFPGMVVRGHGPFVRGNSLLEAMMLTCILEDSALINRYLLMLGAGPIRPEKMFFPVTGNGVGKESFELGSLRTSTSRFRRMAADLFSHRISPFFTGSMSEKTGRHIWFCPRASLPVYFSLPMTRIDEGVNDSGYWIELHRSVFRFSRSGAAIFTHSPRAMIQAMACLSGGAEGIVPDDAEGRYLYPFIPVVSPDTEVKQVVSLAERHRMVILAGLGVLSLGKNLTHAIHHCSSLENICTMKTGLEIFNRLRDRE